MAQFQAGEVVVPVVPDATGFHRQLRKDLVPGAQQLGQQIGQEIARGVKARLGDVYEPLREQARQEQRRAPQDGAQVGGAFARGVKTSLEAAFKSLPKIKLDADATEAQQTIQEIRTRIETLSGKTVGIDIDASAAQAEVAALQRELQALDGKDVSIDVRADIAAALGQLAAAEAALSGLDKQVARPRVDVDIAGAMSAIGTVSVALAALAAIPVGASLTAGIAGLAAPLAAAGAGFAGLAAVAAPSIGRINEALQEQERATQAASGATRSATQVAAQQAQQAFSLEQAERRVADAKKAAKDAEDELTRARQEAKRAIEELRMSVVDAALSEESAALAVEEAQQRLAEVMADPKATDLQRRRAELSVRQAEQAHKRAITRSKELQAEEKAATKAGIEGSDQVKAAKERLAKAEQQVKDAQTQLKILQLQQAAASQQQAKAAGSVASKFKELSPAAQKAAKEIKAFGDAYEDWQKKLEPAVLPAVTGALRVLQSLFKPLTPVITGTAGALVKLEKSAVRALGGTFWRDFFKQVAKEAPGAITNLVKSLGHVITGIAGIIRAFLPFSGTVTGGIEGAARAFANWGKSLKDSQGFKDFIAYVQTNGPKIWQIIKNIGQVIANLFSGVDVAGAGAGVLDMLVNLTTWLAQLSPQTLQTFATAALAVVAAFKGWKIITTVVDGVVKSIQTAKTIWSGISTAASVASKGVQLAAKGITAAARGIGTGVGKAATAVWSGIQTAASKAAGVAKTAGQTIAGAARTAGSVVAKGATAAWDGIRSAAQRAGSAAKTAGSAIANGAKTAGSAVASLGRAALEYGKIAAQAALARARSLAFAAAQAVIKGATLAWAAAQRVLNLALSANPIGLIVTAIGLLVAALVYAWNNSETFRNVVTTVWEAIKTVIQTAWESVIKPALEALWSFVQNTLAPIFQWLWQNVIVPAWQGIQSVTQTVWNNVILPALQHVGNFIKTILAPIFTWIWKNIVVPAWQGIQTTTKTIWQNVIQPALQNVHNFIKNTLGPVFTWIWKNIIVPAWDGIKTTITTVWEQFLKPVFDKLYEVIFKTIPDGFKKGVELIRTAWDKVKDAAKKPVEFIINTVYNNGIVKVWNAVADFLKLPKLSTLAFARGGVVPGYTPGKDVALAAVSGGEAIMRPEWVRAVGEDYVHKMNAAARHGGVAGVAKALGLVGDPGFAGAFAEGGIVGDVKKVLAGGIKLGAETLLEPVLQAAERAMGDSAWGKMLTGIPRRMVAEVIKFLGEKEATAGGGKAVQFARAQIGKPYQWGGTGPDAFDCSGLTMRAWQSAGVKDIPRTSQQQMAWVKPVQSPSPGDLGFPHPGHVWIYSSPSTIIEAPYTGAHVREVAARQAQLIGRPPAAFARGGIVQYARGGIRPAAHITDRPTVLFGEAGPEAYIPLSGRQRRRGLRVLEQAAAAMGQVVLPAGSLAGGGYLEALQSAAVMAAGGIIPPTGSGSAANTAVRQVAGTVRSSTDTISSTLVKSSQILRQALSTGTTVLTGAVGDAWQRASAGLVTTSQTLSQAWDKAAATTAQSITEVAEAETTASSQIVDATGKLGETVTKATSELQTTLVQVATTVSKSTASAAGTVKPSAPGTPEAVKKAAKAASSVVVLLSKNEDIPVRAAAYDSGGWLMPGTSLVYNGTGRPEPVLTDQQWSDLQGRAGGGGPLVNIEGDWIAEGGQSPYAVAQELTFLLGARLRMR